MSVGHPIMVQVLTMGNQVKAHSGPLLRNLSEKEKGNHRPGTCHFDLPVDPITIYGSREHGSFKAHSLALGELGLEVPLS